jgi:SulP family sulfate permease
MPPAYGLYAAMMPCVIAALFGSSRLMVTGPANAISLTTMALVAPLAAVGSSQYVGLVLTLTFVVGRWCCWGWRASASGLSWCRMR